MFDIVRNNKLVAQVILALIILPFALWGVDSYLHQGGGSDRVASVGGSKITIGEFQTALREQQDRIRASAGGGDPAMLESPELRRAVLDNLIQRRLLTLEAVKSNQATSNEQLAAFIASVPQLQEDGKFSQQRYEALIAAQGMSKAAFEANVRQDLTMQQSIVAIGNGVLTGKSAADSWLRAQLEEREVSDLVIRADAFLGRVKVTPEAVKAYYDANQKKFELPEQVRADYVVLSRDKLAENLTITDDEVKEWYRSHGDRYKLGEERRASHILIAVDGKAGDDAQKAAQDKAAEVLAQVRKPGSDFGKLAAQYSQDPGSARKGGDLDWFPRGAMVKPFEDAVFSMKAGEVSDIVRSDFGLHVIKLTGIRPERVRPLEEVKGEIVAELRTQAAAKKYAEMAETFTNVVYEQSDSLAPVAEKFRLPIQKTEWFAKDQVQGLFANSKLKAALFSDDAIKNRRNTEAIEVAPNVIVSARIADFKPAALQSFETVAPTIAKFLAHEEAVNLAVKDGEQKLARLMKGEKVDLAWGKPLTIARGLTTDIPPELVRAIFTADASKLPAFAGVAAPGGYALLRVSKVKPFAMTAEDTPQAKALRGQYARLVAEEELAAWMGTLRAKYPVEIDQAALAGKDNQAN